MPELFIELFSEEIPARMQARAADDLARLLAEVLASLGPSGIETFCGPRRIGLCAMVAAEVPASRTSDRGPRVSAPEQAVAGFLRKHAAIREQLRAEGEFLVLERENPAIGAAVLIATAMPPLLRHFPWQKSMRWGGTSAFTWVRPLRRIVCLLDGAVVPFDLRDGEDDGHGLVSGDVTEGHRFPPRAPFAVCGCADWARRLRDARVVVGAEERRAMIALGIAGLAAARRLTVVDDPGLLDEVVGLVEWPVPLLGRIDAAYMDLPREVMQVSMRVNQRYFALRDADGAAAPWFGFVANILADDGGRTTVAGNERVLRARFADARHFWDLDRRTKLESRVAALDGVTFHARLGTQGARVARLERLARWIAPLVGADPDLAARAAWLAKADLVTGMVGEFPELQGVMGRYYALHDGEPREVADAIRDHYAPKGPADPVPSARVSITVALSDKLDLLAGFFGIGEQPTGSGDPYALRRAALGVVRILRENGLRLDLRALCRAAVRPIPHLRLLPEGEGAVSSPSPSAEGRGDGSAVVADIMTFIAERLRVQLRGEGARHDVLTAIGTDDDIVRLLDRTDAVAAFLATSDGRDLLAAYRRAANILRIEDKRDGPHASNPDPALFAQAEEHALAAALAAAEPAIVAHLVDEEYAAALQALAGLRAPLDAFFDRVTVNADEPGQRRNRLSLLARLRAVMHQIADFSKIEGSSQ